MPHRLLILIHFIVYCALFYYRLFSNKWATLKKIVLFERYVVKIVISSLEVGFMVGCL